VGAEQYQVRTAPCHGSALLRVWRCAQVSPKATRASTQRGNVVTKDSRLRQCRHSVDTSCISRPTETKGKKVTDLTNWPDLAAYSSMNTSKSASPQMSTLSTRMDRRLSHTRRPSCAMRSSFSGPWSRREAKVESKAGLCFVEQHALSKEARKFRSSHSNNTFATTPTGREETKFIRSCC